MSLVRVRSGRLRAPSAVAARSVIFSAQETVSMVLAGGAPTSESDQDIRVPTFVPAVITIPYGGSVLRQW